MFWIMLLEKDSLEKFIELLMRKLIRLLLSKSSKFKNLRSVLNYRNLPSIKYKLSAKFKILHMLSDLLRYSKLLTTTILFISTAMEVLLSIRSKWQEDLMKKKHLTTLKICLRPFKFYQNPILCTEISNLVIFYSIMELSS